MKKLILSLSALICVLLISCSGESYSHDANVLPDNAKKILSQNFEAAISIVKEENDFMSDKEYEVVLADGSEITFNHKGEWTNIETPNNERVPSSLVPKPILDYITQNHAGASIVGIEKEKKGYEVELSNGLELMFNQQGIFTKYEK